MKKIGIWALLADAARARVLRHPGRAIDRAGAPMETIFEVSAEHRPLREIMTDAPGRSFASTGARRSSMEYHSDPAREETRRFAQAILSDLEDRLARQESEQLVIYAPPRMLGLLREAMSERMTSVVISEVPKDITKLPERELRELLEHRE